MALQQDFKVDTSYGVIPKPIGYGYDAFTDSPAFDFGYADVRYENPVPGYPSQFTGFIY